NLSEMDSRDSIALYYNLIGLLKLLAASNAILKDFDFFGSILNHDNIFFSEKLVNCLKQIFTVVLNEIKLFRLLALKRFQAKQTIDQAVENVSELDTEKYMKYFGKLIKVIEQLLCF